MVKNPKLSQAISDVSWGEITDLFRYENKDAIHQAVQGLRTRYNGEFDATVLLNQLKTELFEVKENVGRLFEVVQDFSSNFAALETGFNEIRTTLLYQMMDISSCKPLKHLQRL